MTAEQLNTKLEEKGIKQKFVATRLKVSEGLISQWRNGTTPIPKKHFTNLKALLK